MSKIRVDNAGRVLNVREYQRSDGRYVYKYMDEGALRYVYSWTLNPEDDIPPRVKKGLSLREMEREIKGLSDWKSQGKALQDRITVLNLVDRYLLTKSNVKPSTKNGYITVRKLMAGDEFGLKSIDMVSIYDAKKWLADLQASGKSYSSIHTVRGVINPAFQLALDEKFIDRNPFDFPFSSVVSNDMKKREALSKSEEKEFINFVEADNCYSKYYNLVYILFNTGLRVSELCGLRIADIDFIHGCISINRTLNRFGREYVLTSPKTQSGIRKIPMSGTINLCMREIVENRLCRKQSVEVDGISDFLFIDKKGSPLLPNHIEKYFQRICDKFYDEKNYCIKVTPHICRHTFCTKMARIGMKPKILQYIMGHSKVETTLSYYVHIDYDQVAEEIERVMNK